MKKTHLKVWGRAWCRWVGGSEEDGYILVATTDLNKWDKITCGRCLRLAKSTGFLSDTEGG